MRVLLACVALVAIGCSSGPPAAPSPSTSQPPPQVSRPLEAILVFDGPITSTANPPDFTAWTMQGRGRNGGTGCAGQIRVLLDLLDSRSALIVRRHFDLDPTLVVPPGGTFDYAHCCVSTNELDRTVQHATSYAYATVPCS